MDIIKEYLTVIALAISVAGVIYAWFTRRSEENTEAIEKMEANLLERLSAIDKKQVDYDRRIQRLEDNYKHMPTRDQISEILVAIAQISSTVASTNNAIKRLEDDFRNLKKD